MTLQALDEYALVGGRVFLGAEAGLIDGLAVHVRGDRIVMVGDPTALPPAVPRVEVSGRSLLPGLLDVHVHSEEWHAPLYLAHGVTTVRDVGRALHPVLDRRVRWNEANALAPRLVCCGPLLDGPGPGHTKMSQVVQTPDEGRQAVDELVEAGVDQIKLYTLLDWPTFQAILQQSQTHGKFTLAHMQNLVDARSAVVAGLNEIEHCSGCAEAMYPERALAGESWRKLYADLEPSRLHDLVDCLLEHKVWMAVTRVIWYKIAWEMDHPNWEDPQLMYAPRPLVAWWMSLNQSNRPRQERLDWAKALGAMQIFTATLIERGVKVIAGSDAPFGFVMPGFGLHDELQLLVECGMSPTEAILAATEYAAQAIQVDDDRGTIEVGKRADFVIVDGDPTQHLRALRQVWRTVRGGQFIDPTPLLAQAAAYAETAELGNARRVSDVY